MKTLLRVGRDHTRLTYMIRSILLTLLLAGAAAAYGGVPSMNVIVSDASGKVAFKGATDARATFATANLAPGNYVVQFHSKRETLKGNQYLLVVSAGTKKVIADDVAAEKFNGGGVAMRITVGSGLKITGQIAPDGATVASDIRKIKVIDGKRYVWVKAQIGSNIGDHWEEEGLAAARIVATMSNDKLRQIQDSSYEGSMLDRYHGGQYDVHVHY
jgi:hypothetical protein